MTVSVIRCVVKRPGRGARDRYRFTGVAPTTTRSISRPAANRLKDANVVDHLVGLIREEGRGDRAAEGGRSDATSRCRGVAPKACACDPSRPFQGDFSMTKLQPVRARTDILPDDYPGFATSSATAREGWRAFTAYRDDGAPGVRVHPKLFARASARPPTWSPKEMYTFSDRGGDLSPCGRYTPASAEPSCPTARCSNRCR